MIRRPRIILVTTINLKASAMVHSLSREKDTS
jgi:hypothetical protein